MGWAIWRGDKLDWGTPSGGDSSRGIVRLSDAMQNMRANIWRLPPGARGRRHRELAQEELFVVLDGTATIALGDPAEKIDLTKGSVCVVEPETALQIRNDGDAETVVLIVGAPPETGRADYLPDA